MTTPELDRPAIDRDALAGIRAERIDWRFKGLPDSTFGRTIGEVADAGLNLFADGFVGPLVVLDADALAHNLATFAGWCARRGLRHAPHGKTTMAPQLFARQLDLGAWGITAANASQLRVYRAFGVRRVLLANELVDPAALRWLAAELDRDPGFEFCCYVDSARGVALMDAALRAAAPRRPVDVLVELGAVDARAGVRDVAQGRAVGAAAAACPTLRLTGVAGYEGVLVHDTSERALATVTDYVDRLRALAGALAADGRFAGVPEVIVSAGGSAYFDLIAAALARPWPEGLRVLPVLRSGAYVTHDDGMYRASSPLGEALRLADAEPLRPALRAWAQVTSRPQGDLALLTMGKRDASYDEGLPEPQVVRRAGRVEPLAGCRVTKLGDQHTFLATPPGHPIEVGDWVGFGLSHPCTVFDRWPLLPVVDGAGTVVDLVRTYF